MLLTVGATKLADKLWRANGPLNILIIVAQFARRVIKVTRCFYAFNQRLLNTWMRCLNTRL